MCELLCSCVQSFHCDGFSYCGGFSSMELRLWGVWASVVACGLSSCSSRALEHRLSSCGKWTDLFLDMWDHSESGMSPALAGILYHWATREAPGISIFSPPTPYIRLPCCKHRSKFCILLSPLRSVFIFMFSVASKVCTWYMVRLNCELIGGPSLEDDSYGIV